MSSDSASIAQVRIVRPTQWKAFKVRGILPAEARRACLKTGKDARDADDCTKHESWYNACNGSDGTTLTVEWNIW